MDKADDGSIYPRLTPGKDERAIQDAFENFYAVNVACDLSSQWIARPGPFEYDYRWLSSTGAETHMKLSRRAILSRSTVFIRTRLKSSSSTSAQPG